MSIFARIEELVSSAEGYHTFRGYLVGPDDPRPSFPSSALLDDTTKARIHARFAERFSRFDSRATLSIWMKWHLNTILPPLLLADIMLHWQLPLGFPDVRFIRADDARTAAMKCTDEGAPSPADDPFRRFAPLVFDHLEPLVALLHARSGLTRRVLWSNIGNTFEAMLRRIEQTSGPSPRLASADELLKAPRWADGRANPLQGAVHYSGDPPLRLRKVCCLQYRLPDRRYCAACPVEREDTHAA